MRAAATSVAVARRRCAVAAATPLAALAAVARARGPGFRLHDYGACARRAADSGALFVTQIGPDRNHRADGWVYKVNRVVPGVGAADPSGRRLRAGDRLTWFYCRAQPSGGCQRTLEVTPLSAPGQPLRVRVRGYDNEGRGAAVAGAMVTAGDRTRTHRRGRHGGVSGAGGSRDANGCWPSGRAWFRRSRRWCVPDEARARRRARARRAGRGVRPGRGLGRPAASAWW